MTGQHSKQPEWRLQQYSQWTRDVTSLMAVVISLAAFVITLGTLAGFFHFPDTLPIYILLALILPVWWAARSGGWRWARYFPVLLCFGLGMYATSFSGFQSLYVLFYALAVLLSGMLVGSWLSYACMVASVTAYSLIGILVDGFSFGNLAYIITFSFGLVGVTLLQEYMLAHLQRALKAQIASNETLKQEIELRRDVERVQHDQESQLRRLAENMTDLVAEMDAEGRLLYVSPSYHTMLGYDPAELLGTNGFLLVHPDDIDEVRQHAWQAMENRTPAQMQMRTRCADGKYILVEVAGNPLYDQQGKFTGYVLSSRDVTRQKKAETDLQESERKFRTIIEALPMAVHIYNLEEDDRLVFSGFNPMANRMMGMDHTVLLGKTIEEAFPNLVGTEIPDCYREIARSGGMWENERVDYQEAGRSGAFEVHAFQSSPGRLVVVFADIIRRIQSDQALRLSEQKFSTAFMTSPDAININRLSDGVFLDINLGFTRLTGYTREDVLGRSSLALNIWRDPDDRARLVQGLREAGVVENLEAYFHRKNGEVGVGLMSAGVIEIQGELCILSITRDISERIRAENSLRESEVRLREAHCSLNEAYAATLQGWVRALELRERETADHSQRVVEQTVQMGNLLGISGDALVQLQRGALLHDIGKLGVPDQVLLKPGALTSEEWAVMRQHPVFARDLLNTIDYLRPCIDIPFCHHERWDGTGYPRGLKFEQIPLSARIFAVVDVYDALTHNRPYRPAWSHKDAIQYLTDQSSRQFDPFIVKVFIEEQSNWD